MVIWEEKPQLKKYLNQTACRHVYKVFFRLKIDVRVLSQMRIVSPHVMGWGRRYHRKDLHQVYLPHSDCTGFEANPTERFSGTVSREL